MDARLRWAGVHNKATSDMMQILSPWKCNTLEGATSIITYDACW